MSPDWLKRSDRGPLASTGAGAERVRAHRCRSAHKAATSARSRIRYSTSGSCSSQWTSRFVGLGDPAQSARVKKSSASLAADGVLLHASSIELPVTREVLRRSIFKPALHDGLDIVLARQPDLLFAQIGEEVRSQHMERRLVEYVRLEGVAPLVMGIADCPSTPYGPSSSPRTP